MVPVIGFIGWHNSGKTTLARQVVAHLKAMGLHVGVIKSTKETGIVVDRPHTDTDLYKEAGADGVALLAPDQLIVQCRPPGLALPALAERLFPEADLVVAEGFKHAADVAKIEVRRDAKSPLLRDLVPNVIAVATDLPLCGGVLFRLDQSREIADWLATQFLKVRLPPSDRSASTNPDRR